MSVLKLKNFSLSFFENGKHLLAVNNISLEIEKAQIVALIGESGCGKSATALSIIGLENERSEFSGAIEFEGKDILKLSKKELSQMRGSRISMIFQEPMTALNPLLKVGKQVEENLIEHQKIDRKRAKEEVIKALKNVELRDAERIYQSYPHQLSGGQRQRIMIAMALINNPSLLIADEPTTALDVTIQAGIIELIKKLNREKGTAVLLISHNLSLVKGLSDVSYIMYAGIIVESGKTEDILTRPIHPYTRALLLSVPHASSRGHRLYSIEGSVPPLEERTNKGCPFAPRCMISSDLCYSSRPDEKREGERKYFCHYSEKEIERRMKNE